MATTNNTVFVVGNLTRDPELRFTDSGRAFARLGIAETPRRRNDSGGWEDGNTNFLNATAWGEIGEHAAESLKSGQRVVVIGQLRYRTWLGKNEDGTENADDKRSAVEINVDEIGPSLRWATAVVEKATRKGADDASPDPTDEGEF